MADPAQLGSASSMGPGSPRPDFPDSHGAQPRSPASESLQLLFLAVAPLAFSGFYLWQVVALPDPGRPLVVPPRAWPLITAVVLVVVSAGMTLAIATWRWRPVGDGNTSELSLRDVLSTAVALLIFMAVFERLGFLLSAGLLMFALSTLTSPQHWKRNAVAAVAFAVVSEALFDRVLGVHLPPGVLTLPLQ